MFENQSKTDVDPLHYWNWTLVHDNEIPFIRSTGRPVFP